MSAVRVPWLAPAEAILGQVIAAQPILEAVAAVAVLVPTLTTLLARFIGDALVGHVLHEMWPDVFPSREKEPG